MLLSDGRTLEYKYDAEERITKVIDSVDSATEYTYDALGQLLTERLNGHIINSMTYDTYGNIISKNGQTYFYDSTWHDLLTGIESESIEYDAQGNPVKYLGHTLTWEKGRQLKSFDNNTYTYNANGIRTSKAINGVKHEYTLDGTKILRETWNGNTLVPIYDSEDSVCGIIYNGTPHYFLKNLQGDIIAIANAKGEVEARYTYDAWGAITNISGTDEGISIAVVNPFRYRGYYYDVEIGLYYLQSRYYDACVGRFVTAYCSETILSDDKLIVCNIYTYCYNDPINNVDLSGSLIASTIAKIVLGVLFGLLVQFIADIVVFVVRRLIEGKNASFNPSLGDYVGSALTWGLASVNPFGQKHKILAKLFNFVPVIAKYACKWICGEKINIFDLLTDLLAVIVSLIVSSAISANTAKKIKNLKKLNRSKLKTPGFKFKKMELKYAGKILGKKFSFAFNLSPTVVQTIYHCIVGVE